MTTPAKFTRRSRGQMLAEQVARLPYEQLVRFANELAQHYGATATQVRQQIGLSRAPENLKYEPDVSVAAGRGPAVPQPPEVKG